MKHVVALDNLLSRRRFVVVWRDRLPQCLVHDISITRRKSSTHGVLISRKDESGLSNRKSSRKFAFLINAAAAAAPLW